MIIMIIKHDADLGIFTHTLGTSDSVSIADIMLLTKCLYYVVIVVIIIIIIDDPPLELVCVGCRRPSVRPSVRPFSVRKEK